MPPNDETQWWRGKRGFEVGFFPAECVEVIGDTIPQSMTSKIPQTPPKPGRNNTRHSLVGRSVQNHSSYT